MTATIVDTPVFVTEEQARAALAELIAKHGLPEPAEEPRLRVQQLVYSTYGSMWVKAASRADVELWAKALRRKAKTTQTITDDSSDGSWSVLWTVEVALRDWLPGVRLTVDHWDHRRARSDEQERAERDAVIDRCFESMRTSRGTS